MVSGARGWKRGKTKARAKIWCRRKAKQGHARQRNPARSGKMHALKAWKMNPARYFCSSLVKDGFGSGYYQRWTFLIVGTNICGHHRLLTGDPLWAQDVRFPSRGI